VSVVDFFKSPLAARLAGAALGIVFIVAAVPKIVDPPGFAHEVANYQILPRAAVNAVALVLPWVEMLAGVALLAGFARRSAAVLTLGLLAVFLAGLTVNLARNHPVDCGCFSTKEAPKTPEERLSAMKLAILRDVGFVVLGVWSLRRTSNGRRVARTVDSESAA
jgi:putative oxidoreductase